MQDESVYNRIDRKKQIAEKVEQIMLKSDSWPASLEMMEERVRTLVGCEWSELEKGWVAQYRQLFCGIFALLKGTVNNSMGIQLNNDILKTIKTYIGRDQIMIMHSNLSHPCAHLRKVCEEQGFSVKSCDISFSRLNQDTHPSVITFVVKLNGQELFLSTSRFINLSDIQTLIRGYNSENSEAAKKVELERKKVKCYEVWVENFLKSTKLEMSIVGPCDVFARCLITLLRTSEDVIYRDVPEGSAYKSIPLLQRAQIWVRSNGITTRQTVRNFNTKLPKSAVGQLVMRKIPKTGVTDLIHKEITRAQQKHAFEVWKEKQRKLYNGKKRTGSLRFHVRKRREELREQLYVDLQN